MIKTRDGKDSSLYSDITELVLDLCEMCMDADETQFNRPYVRGGELSFGSVQNQILFLLDCLQNEFDTISNAVTRVDVGAHNDRIASILTAMQQYKKALLTRDATLKKNTLKDADRDLTNALNALTKEIEQNTAEFRRMPTSFLGKMFSRASIGQIDTWLNMVHESTRFFMGGICLLIDINRELNEEMRLIDSVTEYAMFLKAEFADDNIKLLIGYDKNENRGKWIELQQWTQKVNQLAQHISIGEITKKEKKRYSQGIRLLRKTH